MIYVVGNIELDMSCYECRRDGKPQPMQPQVFNVLHYLITNRHRVVSKHELLEALWPGQHVSESALTQRIRAARRALGDSGEQQAYIKTLYRRGYRFVAPVDVHSPVPCAPGHSQRSKPLRSVDFNPENAYRQYLEVALTRYAQLSADPDTVRTEVVFDRHRSRYQLIHTGWDHKQLALRHIIQIEIIDNIIWIQRDDTQAGLIATLIEEGIPETCIRIISSWPREIAR